MPSNLRTSCRSAARSAPLCHHRTADYDPAAKSDALPRAGSRASSCSGVGAGCCHALGVVALPTSPPAGYAPWFWGNPPPHHDGASLLGSREGLARSRLSAAPVAAFERSSCFTRTNATGSTRSSLTAARPATLLELAPPSLNLRSEPELDTAPPEVDRRVRHVVVSVLIDAHGVVVGQPEQARDFVCVD